MYYININIVLIFKTLKTDVKSQIAQIKSKGK
jgi:hypothetical protein